MEEERPRVLRRPRGDKGSALVVVLVAIVVMLPMTLVLMSLVFQRQRQSMDFRDLTALEFAAEAGLEKARLFVVENGSGVAPGDSRALELRDVGALDVVMHVARRSDIVLTANGGLLEGVRASEVDTSQTGIDAEGRVVYQYRRVEIYLVRVEARKRPTLAGVRLDGVIAKLPDGTLQTLGVNSERVFLEAR